METNYIIAGICYVILGGLGIFLYYKRKHKKFLESLKNKNFTILKKLNMETEFFGKLAFRYRRDTADVIILEDKIFLLLYSNPLGIAHQIYQICNCTESFPFISKKLSLDSKYNDHGRLRINGKFGHGITGGKYSILLDFNRTGFDLNSIL
ncbi:hypothetical protein F3J23_06450 [Chryseobacterium sp. Tr-659]|uniref:hypothetical protein n=1 Tax=Chryseobacterium sp. Tr-659 TaxID=2608340 RepID=UPI001420EE13|nr:hypothetical protein [Chryseobacterium sp. Tr-659]NIF05079.1 hypothetical protein [Chryseobacterium sp. Tr-659]